MNKILYTFATPLVIIAILGSVWLITPRDETSAPSVSPTPAKKIALPSIAVDSKKLAVLPVLYINEAPSGNWSGPWKNACEEASIAMVDYYYRGKRSVSIREAEEYMTILFEKQNSLYGSNANSDAVQFKYLIDNFTSFNAQIVRNPTIEQIKEQIDLKHPVISLHYGFALENPNIPFLRTGSSYHTMAIIGYDDAARQFIVNDDGDIKAGAGHRYGYELFMNSLHDYNYTDGKADGPATVLFTAPK